MRVLLFLNRHDASLKIASDKTPLQWPAKDVSCIKAIFHWLAFCAVLYAFAVISSANAQTVRNIGPFQVSFYNSGDPGDEGGASSQNWTGPEIEDITSCIATWASGITNAPGRQIKLHLFWNSLGSNILGQTSNPSVGNGTVSWSDTERVWRTGVNLSASQSYDARISLSTGINWNIGSAAPLSNQYDLRSVITHELGHTLGFDSTYDPSTDKFSSNGLSAWDNLLTDSSSGGNRPSVGGTGTPGNFNQIANPVYFTGPLAEAAYGAYLGANVSTPVPVYAPNPYQDGSSMSHLNQSSLPDALMRPAFGNGASTRSPLPLEWAIMQDLGWTVAGVKSWTNGAGTLNWGNTSNWGPSGLPDSSSNVTFTSSGLTNGNTINMGGNRTINALSIDSTVNFTIGGGSGALTLNSGYITRTIASSGTQTISQPLVVSANSTIANTVWDISGSGNLTIAGSLTVSNSITALTKVGTGMIVLAGTSTVPGTLNIDDGDLTLNSGAALTVNNIAGAGGALNFDGGTLNLTGTNVLHLYGVRVGKDATGAFTLLPGKTLTTDVFLTIGRDNGGQGTFTNQGGTVNATTKIVVGTNSGSNGHYIQQSSPNPGDPLPITNVGTGTTYVGSYLGASGGVGLLEMKSGTFTTAGLETGFTGTGTFTQSGGAVTVTGTLDIAYQAQGTYNLTGGTLLLSSLTKGTGAAAFNFGGGIMKASSSFSSNVPLTLTGIGGDSTIDTQTNTVTFSGNVSGSGGLKKIGAGTLALAPPSISPDNLHTISGIGTLVVGNGLTASLLTADSINISTLTISAGSAVTINPIPGGPVSISTPLNPVPEPSTLLILLSAVLFSVAFYIRKKAH
jgi:PEP-CTERM motif